MADAATTAQPEAEEDDRPPLPHWNWRTFPVYFALSLGGFVGGYAGYLTGYVHGNSGDALPSTIMFGVLALLLGFGVARLGVRGLMGWGVIRPTPRRPRK
ncbi:hypothetical protein J0H33_14795 [bacterium]|nr:hypothetical protein [bacterium]